MCGGKWILSVLFPIEMPTCESLGNLIDGELSDLEVLGASRSSRLKDLDN